MAEGISPAANRAPLHPAHPTAVIVLAAGSGTRMKSALPKMLHPVCGRTMLGHALHAAAGIAPERIVVVVGHERQAVSAAALESAAEFDTPVTTAVQEHQNGTGDAVLSGLGALPADFTGTVLVTTSDVPLLDAATLSGLAAAHAQSPAAAVTVLTSTQEDPTGYGRIVRNADGEVLSIVEHRDATAEQLEIAEVNSGVYAFDSAALRGGLQRLVDDPQAGSNAQGEIYLTDIVSLARQDGRIVRAHRVADAAVVAGVNDRVQLAELTAQLRQRITEYWMREGVTFVDPASCSVDVEVVLARDVTVLPGTHLLGRTVIGANSQIGPDTTLENVVTGRGVTVTRTHGTAATIADLATVGPFAYLRPGTSLGNGGKIGTFVETKNADIGAGSKVPHLTYAGDVTIGQGSNIGASSVFVNYDGVNKHHTVIGSHVRTGSDTKFIAPITVGDGAYTGAGTVLKQDVPAGALAVSGGKQRNLEGWVQEHRPDTPSAHAAQAAQSARPGGAKGVESGLGGTPPTDDSGRKAPSE